VAHLGNGPRVSGVRCQKKLKEKLLNIEYSIENIQLLEIGENMPI
jgi:hypothetical protein